MYSRLYVVDLTKEWDCGKIATIAVGVCHKLKASGSSTEMVAEESYMYGVVQSGWG